MIARRTHRKSRLGCSECKKRHIKCDESRPVCLNCSRTGRECSFVHLTPSVPVQSPTPSSPASQIRSEPTSDYIDDPPVNMVQMELLAHFMSCPTLGFIEVLPKASDLISPSKFVQEALGCDYLMNELLAFSARHLATLRPEKSPFYLYHASNLQTHALSLFTSAHAVPNKNNCTHILFFSWLLGIHLLCDVPTARSQDDILERFLHCFELFRGIRVVTIGAWKFLLESEYQKIFKDGAAAANNVSAGSHTSSLLALVRDSLGMDEAQKTGCEEAIARLQWVFEVHDRTGPEEVIWHSAQVALSWPLTVTPEFLQCLQARRPEALLVLAHFAVILSWCKSSWIFGPVGSQLLDGIVSSLGPGWERWLQWPKEMIQV
ncbi:hypothetical protein B0J13DRAFT_454640 [Dactylonectria estremocensis]|uniref:Zn(2)-C6 fungal-type domain-containing protein n=1 Tax=Dactylonectria estremocensis TaxID=1079267 RepID=A0A9P9DTQ8_9HYPO|nr:hypothetical protein B0J13DRAFT_454640 [Dactylonectria estremocensis]